MRIYAGPTGLTPRLALCLAYLLPARRAQTNAAFVLHDVCADALVAERKSGFGGSAVQEAASIARAVCAKPCDLDSRAIVPPPRNRSADDDDADDLIALCCAD